ISKNNSLASAARLHRWKWVALSVLRSRATAPRLSVERGEGCPLRPGPRFPPHKRRVGRSRKVRRRNKVLISCAVLNDKILGMTPDERAQLIEDIDRSANIREGIVGQARLSKQFDIAAAWQELEELDRSINERMVKARRRDS